MSFRNILITGGSGFIGSNLVRFVLRERPQATVTNLDLLTYSGNPDNLADLTPNPRYRFVRGDICDSTFVNPLVAECDAILHLAAESHVDRSIIDASPFIRTNVAGTQVILDALRRIQSTGKVPPRLLYVSTDEVYGSLTLDASQRRFTEDSPLLPNSPYAASKAAGDCLVRAYGHTYNLDLVITRCSNNFGPCQFPEKIIPLFVTNLLQGKRVPLYGDGLHVRDWLHVEDHCEALLAVLERGRSGEVYNIGAKNERSNLELTRTVLLLLDQPSDMIQQVPDRPGHDRRYAIDASKIARELNWKPTRSAWPEALAATVEWYRRNEAWWRRVLSGEYRRARTL